MPPVFEFHRSLACRQIQPAALIAVFGDDFEWRTVPPALHIGHLPDLPERLFAPATVIDLSPLTDAGRDALFEALSNNEVTFVPMRILDVDDEGTVFGEYHAAFAMICPVMPTVVDSSTAPADLNAADTPTDPTT
jgi:hypothetical protein